MTTGVEFLLIGGGLAAATAAATLRDEGAQGTITLLAGEEVLPYHRPILTLEQLPFYWTSFYDPPAVAEHVKQRPLYIETIGQSGPLSITRIVHDGEEGEVLPKTMNFRQRPWSNIYRRATKRHAEFSMVWRRPRLRVTTNDARPVAVQRLAVVI